MALDSRTENVPRDANPIDTRSNGNILAALVVLLLLAVALGLYFYYAGSMTPERTINAPSTTQINPPANIPVPQPKPTTP
jgi:hypothetical protein